ncbi:MAG: UDP-N-acetylmuramate dehydrogenase [Candidatus Staskawiczbacteria bacterium]|jgi:UDP-N-acetylmuramate dehydrogenase
MADKILQKLPGIQKNVLLEDFTTYKIGGPAKYFFVARTKDDLIFALKTANDFKLSVLILGGGSNLLISDNGFNGLVIKIDISGINFQGNKAIVGAGMGLANLAYLSAENGLSGLEWAAGIPGATVGGSIYGHAQAFGIKISDVVKEVEAINIETLKIKKFSKKQCQFSLKNSIFKENKNLIIVSAVLEFQKKDKNKIKKTIEEFLEYRKTRHPIDFASAGSTFINPEIKIKNKKLLEKFPELNEYNKKGTIPAGYLIAKCNLAGKKIGNAQISEKHANFIINLGGAKAKDILKLMKLAKEKVKKTFGINLETEVQIL